MSDEFHGSEDPEVEARLTLALVRTSRHLGQHEIEQLRNRIAKQVGSARRMRAVPLANSDEPALELNPTRSAHNGEGGMS